VTRRLLVAALALAAAGVPAVGRGFSPGVTPGLKARPASAPAQLASDLDAIFADPILARALVGVRIDSLATGRTLYARDAGRLVMPASNMKIVTLAVAAERLGWDYRYETRLEAAGTIDAGVLHGDLVVVGTGDPSIVSLDAGPAPVFGEWADALRAAGIRRVDGRIIGDDRAFEGAGLGGGWSWDYLADGYAASSGALNYNENVAAVAISAGTTAGAPADVTIGPPGHGLEIANETRVAVEPAGGVDLFRMPGSSRLVVRGQIAPGRRLARTTTVDSPTRFFVEALRQALAGRGIAVASGSADIDEIVPAPAAPGRRLIARRESMPLSALAGYFMKVSQNFYAETILKTLGRTAGGAGSIAAGRRTARDVLTAWGITPDSYVIADGSGLSRYDYVTADAMVVLLTRVWTDARLRGPFVATLPVGGQDGTLASRMKGTALETNVQAKTGTIANVRALSGYVQTKAGEKLVFSIIANHFTAPSGAIDAIVEKALARVVGRE
jgi:D-alanyl-D-alanine carboxypeptidase/D-alanyl-D-alanine-endopeptidase (penicillin-binding protein 4)